MMHVLHDRIPVTGSLALTHTHEHCRACKGAGYVGGDDPLPCMNCLGSGQQTVLLLDDATAARLR